MVPPFVTAIQVGVDHLAAYQQVVIFQKILKKSINSNFCNSAEKNFDEKLFF